MSTCEHCGRMFDPAETHGTYNGSTARFVCPSCGRGTSGLPLIDFSASG